MDDIFYNISRVDWKASTMEEESCSTTQIYSDELQYHEAFVDWLTGESARGRKLILATASDRLAAEIIAAHVGLFDDVMGSDGKINLRDQEG